MKIKFNHSTLHPEKKHLYLLLIMNRVLMESPERVEEVL